MIFFHEKLAARYSQRKSDGGRGAVEENEYRKFRVKSRRNSIEEDEEEEEEVEVEEVEESKEGR